MIVFQFDFLMEFPLHSVWVLWMKICLLLKQMLKAPMTVF